MGEYIQQMNGPRDCIHGHLARKCPHCDAERTEYELNAQIAALAAEVERLRLALQEAQHELESCDNCPPDVLERIEAALEAGRG